MAKAPAGSAWLGHGTSSSIEAAKLGAEAQRLLGDDDGLRARHGRPGVDLARPHIGLVVKPGLGDEDGEQAENDGKPDHDDGAGTHYLKRPEYFLTCVGR